MGHRFWCCNACFLQHEATAGPGECYILERERGFTLIELMIVMAVAVVLMTAAAVNMAQVARNTAQATAKRRALQTWSIVGEDAVCRTLQPGQCAALDAMMPQAGPVRAGAYSYTYTVNPAGWTFTATPLQPGLAVIVIDNTGALTCGAGPC